MARYSIRKRVISIMAALAVMLSLFAGLGNVKVDAASKKAFSSSKVKVESTEIFYPYTGYSIYPDFNVYYKNGSKWSKLKEGRDYEVTEYYNNKKPGNGDVLVKGKGNYMGSIRKNDTFIISPGTPVVSSKSLTTKKLKCYVFSPGSSSYKVELRDASTGKVIKSKTSSDRNVSISGLKLKKGKKYKIYCTAFIKAKYCGKTISVSSDRSSIYTLTAK